MRSKSDLTAAQQDVIDRLYETDYTFLIAKMGGGKTVCTLTAISELIRDGVLNRVLVIAPLKVCNEVWGVESGEWEHLLGLTVAVATGGKQKRIEALSSEANIVAVNYDVLPWLMRETRVWEQFDGLVLDELSRMKSPGGAGFRALRPRLGCFKWRVGLTGTPVSEDWTGLFGQMLMVDGGASLGTRKDLYLRRFFYPTDYNEYNWELQRGGAAEIAARIRECVYTMPEYRHELPEIVRETVPVYMPEAVREAYARLRSDFSVDMEDGLSVVAANAAVLTGKLAQCASGFLYHEAEAGESVSGSAVATAEISRYRIDVCVDHVKTLCDARGGVMLSYWYRRDGDLLRDALERAGLHVMDVREDGAVGCWNRREIDVLMVHPRSAGHGLNLAQGGATVVWYAPIWSRDLWEQTEARVWRRGQTREVKVFTLCAVESVDELMLARLESKADYDVLLMEHLRE